jgi:hypothetical protein
MSTAFPLFPVFSAVLSRKYTVNKLYGNDCKIEKNEMGWACGAYGGGERCA